MAFSDLNSNGHYIISTHNYVTHCSPTVANSLNQLSHKGILFCFANPRPVTALRSGPVIIPMEGQSNGTASQPGLYSPTYIECRGISLSTCNWPNPKNDNRNSVPWLSFNNDGGVITMQPAQSNRRPLLSSCHVQIEGRRTSQAGRYK